MKKKIIAAMDIEKKEIQQKTDFLRQKLEYMKLKGKNIFTDCDAEQLLDTMCELNEKGINLLKEFAVLEGLNDLTSKRAPQVNADDEKSKAIKSVYSCLSNLNPQNKPEIFKKLANSFRILGFKDIKRRVFLMQLLKDAMNDIETFKLLLDMAGSEDIDMQDEEGKTLLICAAGARKEEIVRLLLDRKASIDIQESQGYTALMHLIGLLDPIPYARDAEYVRSIKTIAELLIRAGADINLANNQGISTAHILIEKNQKDLTMHVLQIENVSLTCKDTSGKIPLMMVLSDSNYRYKNDSELIKLVLQKTVNINEIETGFGFRTTALMMAVLHSDTEVVKEFLKRQDLDVNFKNKYGETALIIAINRSAEKKALILINDPRIDLNCETNEGLTPFFVSIKAGKEEVLNALFNDPRCDKYSQSQSGTTALMFTASVNSDLAVRTLIRLIKAGADIDAVDKYGYTALFYALDNQTNLKAFKVLLVAGADIEIKNKNGRTIRDIVRDKGNRELIEALGKIS
ncbi:MAG: ankyrin repeat domain-containing protein [Candidatus Margulisbacteria bacterium]|nr:ankyrin repeat domain-containing protein [Candidatus Margulisiibacteriota bacterium]